MSNHVKIDISAATIIKIALIILGIWFLFVIRDILVLLFIVLIIVAALTPLVDAMAKFIPRFLAVLILALVFLGALVGIGFMIVPPLIVEIKQLAINLPIIISKLGPIYHSVQVYMGNYQETLLNFSSQLGKLTTGIYSTTVGLITGVIGLLTITILSFYLLIEHETINANVYNLISPEKREKVASLVKKISTKMSQWLGGNLLLMLIIGLVDGIALWILGVPYALILGIWGGLTEIIPYMGPWLGAIPAVIIAFTVSPLTALFVLIAYIVIQQLESTFLAPKIIGKAVGLSPVIIILSLLAGAKLMGILGVIIAVPIAAVISVLINNWDEVKVLNK